jgi:hypothetical protein
LRRSCTIIDAGRCLRRSTAGVSGHRALGAPAASLPARRPASFFWSLSWLRVFRPPRPAGLAKPSNHATSKLLREVTASACDGVVVECRWSTALAKLGASCVAQWPASKPIGNCRLSGGHSPIAIPPLGNQRMSSRNSPCERPVVIPHIPGGEFRLRATCGKTGFCERNGQHAFRADSVAVLQSRRQLRCQRRHAAIASDREGPISSCPWSDQPTAWQ